MKNLMRDLPAWGISLIVNLGILVPLHFIFLEANSPDDSVEISSIMEELTEEEWTLSNDPTVVDTPGTEGDSFEVTPAHLAAASLGPTQVTPQQRILDDVIAAPQPPESPVLIPETASITDVLTLKGDPSVDERARGIEGTMDRIAYEITMSLRERQTLVVWLFDGSQSLNDRRAQIADRFEHVYKQLENLGAKDGLYTAVAAYQDQAALITPQPVTDVSDVIAAVRNIQPDKTTPKENVFSALKLVMNRWETFRRNEGRWNKLVFIVTDEKGENDDAAANMEEVINYAKRFQFRCFVAGNAAIFGQEKGAVLWKYEDGYEEWLYDVDQGPESAFPHVIQLPFWGSGQVRLSAGYGPYALTRLCSETGGAYLMTHDSAAVQFDTARMREYRPDYRPVRVVDAEIRAQPSMAALRAVSSETYDRLRQIPLPTLLFSAENDTQLRQAITEAQRPMADTEYWVERMLSTLEQGKQARDSLADPAWRASFDLAMGRLLAMRVRLKGYNLMLAQMKASPRSFERQGSNEWRLVPSKEIDTGPKMRQVSEEARSLLKRVIDEHQGTPWEQLAVKELGQDLGWAWQEGMHYVPGMENRTDLDQDQVRLLLAEEQRRQQRQQMAGKPREKPNL
jgi:hypothetical protein